MSPFRRSIAAAFVVASLSAFPAGAETLEQAWALALEADDNLEAARASTEAADAELGAVRGARLPSVALSAAFTQLDDAPALDIDELSELGIELPSLFSGDNFVTGAAEVSVPLYTGGLIGNGIRAASAALDASRSGETALVNDLRLAVADAFVLVLRARSALGLAESNVDTLQAHARDVVNLFDKGLVPQNDRLSVEVTLADARQEALQAANALELATAAYNRRLGRPLNTAVDLEEVMPSVAPAAMSADVETLTAEALDNRAELAVLSSQSEALRHQGEAERGRARPQLAAQAGWDYIENEVLDDESLASVGIGVEWKLYDGGQSRRRAAALDARARAATDRRDDIASQIRLQVRGAWLDVDAARERLGVTEQALAQAEENLRVARDRYRNGIGSNTEVLDAETLRTLTRSNHDNARYDAALARLRLASALGVL